MRRRDFLWAFAGATVVPLEARAEPTLPNIDCLFPGASTFRLPPAFPTGLSEFGFVDGKSVRIVYRLAEGQCEPELVARKVDVIAAGETRDAQASAQALGVGLRAGIHANVGYMGVLTTGRPCSSMRRSLPEPAQQDKFTPTTSGGIR